MVDFEEALKLWAYLRGQLSGVPWPDMGGLEGGHMELNSDFIPIPIFLRMGNHAWNQNILGDSHTIFITISSHVQIPRSERNKVGRSTHCELSAPVLYLTVIAPSLDCKLSAQQDFMCGVYS